MAGQISPLSQPAKAEHGFKRVAILFAGGPAPAANAVISTCAVSFLRNNVEVLGILHGYSNLMQYGPERPMEPDRDYIKIDHRVLKRTRNSQGILIGTARANPGKEISDPSHLHDPQRVAPLKTVYEALCSLGVDALISIGGDDTLKTANKFKLYQKTLEGGAHRIPIVHLPKTIDNDYKGIDFTFGFFTAVDTLAVEIRNLVHDAEASQSYFLCETMGRSAGWLAYGAAIAGEASLVISVEDIVGEYCTQETSRDETAGETVTREVMDRDKVVNRIVQMMLAREAEGKNYGVIVLAEGLAERLANKYLEGVPRDEHGHIAIADVNLSRMFSRWVRVAYQRAVNPDLDFNDDGEVVELDRDGNVVCVKKGVKNVKERKVTGLQLGYECRCAKPHAFDVMLGSQLGVGAYRALVEKGHDGVMVSVSGQLELHYVPFEKLVNPKTLVTIVRHIDPDSDFHNLARFLETYVNVLEPGMHD